MIDSHAITITSANCTAVTGMSWKWLRRFARANGVPVWRLSRRSAIPARQLFEAMEAAAAEQEPATLDQRVEAKLAALARRISA